MLANMVISNPVQIQSLHADTGAAKQAHQVYQGPTLPLDFETLEFPMVVEAALSLPLLQSFRAWWTRETFDLFT